MVDLILAKLLASGVRKASIGLWFLLALYLAPFALLCLFEIVNRGK